MSVNFKLRSEYLVKAAINLLGKNDLGAESLLRDIHRSLPSDRFFYEWCLYAEAQGYYGPRLTAFHRAKGSKVGETICNVLLEHARRNAGGDKTTLAIADAVATVFLRRITW